MAVTKKSTLYYQEGSSDKVYVVEVREDSGAFSVMGFNGRRGETLNSQPKGSGLSESEAQKLFNKIVKEKTGKGYKPGGDSGSEIQAPAGEGPKGFPDGLSPMLLNEVEEREGHRLLQDENWMLQPKFDGHRCWLISDTNGSVTGLSRVGNEKALDMAIVKAAQARTKENGSFIIDGELIGDTFVCFDVIETGGLDLTSLAACYRSGFIQTMWQGGKAIVPTTTAYGQSEKSNLYAACFQQGVEGVVLKRKDAKYQSGRPNSGGNGLKLKFVHTCEVICGGRRGDKRSVKMQLADGTEVGSVTIPLNKEIPPAGQVLSIRYLYRGSEDGHLVQAVYLGTRAEVLVSQCTADKLRVKGAPRGNA